MFRVSLTDLIVVYLVLILLLLFAVWIFGDYRRKRREKRERKFHLVCDICGVSYEDRSKDPIPACPNCGRRNERVFLRDI